MCIVRERRGVISAFLATYLERAGNAHHIPASVRRIAVHVTASLFRVEFAARKLKFREVALESSLLHRLPNVIFRLGLLMTSESLFIQPCHRKVESCQILCGLPILF